MVGLSITGVVFLSGMDLDNIDGVYPAPYNGKPAGNARSNFDECLAHSTPTPSNLYHYHVMPPCLADPLLF